MVIIFLNIGKLYFFILEMDGVLCELSIDVLRII
jgi:hypothetical protein